MKIGVTITPLLPLFNDVQEVGEVLFAEGIGINHVEIHTTCLDNIVDSFLKLTERFGLTCSIHCPHMCSPVKTNFCSAVPETIKRSDEWLVKSIEHAKKINSKVVIIHPEIPEKCSRQEALNILENHLRKAFSFLGKGQRILVENMPNNEFSISTADEMIDFLKRFENEKTQVGVCWDVGHESQRLQGFDFQYPKKLKSWIKEVHISGVHKKEGFTDHFPITSENASEVKLAIDELKKIGYKGNVVMEITTKNPADIIGSKDELMRAMS